MNECKHQDDKCEYWYMGLCELDDRLNVCPYDPLYKQLQEFGKHNTKLDTKAKCPICDIKLENDDTYDTHFDTYDTHFDTDFNMTLTLNQIGHCPRCKRNYQWDERYVLTNKIIKGLNEI